MKYSNRLRLFGVTLLTATIPFLWGCSQAPINPDYLTESQTEEVRRLVEENTSLKENVDACVGDRDFWFGAYITHWYEKSQGNVALAEDGVSTHILEEQLQLDHDLGILLLGGINLSYDARNMVRDGVMDLSYSLAKMHNQTDTLFFHYDELRDGNPSDELK
ncbi:MAG: hypothetical protein KKH88_04935 [Nanoarchaeota archaeon]|nr:hypothetical protein [Nanoarchaeota archaeon]